MVRLVFSPAALEEAFCERVAPWRDEHATRIMRKVFEKRRNPDSYLLLICEDCRSQRMKTRFDRFEGLIDRLLHDKLGFEPRIMVQVLEFSFYKWDPHLMMRMLAVADMFYMCGIHEIPEGFRNAFVQQNPLVRKVRELVRYNQMSYWGVCGGGGQDRRTHI